MKWSSVFVGWEIIVVGHGMVTLIHLLENVFQVDLQ